MTYGIKIGQATDGLRFWAVIEIATGSVITATLRCIDAARIARDLNNGTAQDPR